MTPPCPVTEAGAGDTGAVASEDQVVPAATFVVSKGSTMPEGQASWTCEGCALCAVPSTMAGADDTHMDAEATTAAAIPAPIRVVRELAGRFVISSSTRIGRLLRRRPGTRRRRSARG